MTAPVTVDQNCTTERGAATCAELANNLYRLRARVACHVLAIGQDAGLTESPTVWRTELQDRGGIFFSADLSAWITGNEQAVAAHESAGALIEAIVAAAVSGHQNQPDVRDPWRRQVRFFLLVDCLDLLVPLLQRRQCPEGIVAQLPGDLERLYVATQLLRRGVRSEGLIELALQECEKRRTTATAQASHERNECLIVLQDIVPDRVPRLQQEREGLTWFYTGGRSAGARLAASIDSDVDATIEQLEAGIGVPSDAILLAEWNAAANTWSSILLSEAYARMFTLRRILPGEAIAICESVLTASSAIPSTDAVVEHRSLYSAILERLRGVALSPPQVRDTSNPIVRSHQLATEILRAGADGIEPSDLRWFFIDERGWETGNYRWDDNGRISHGSGVSYHLLAFFPAVRLALCAVGRDCDWSDPAFDWTCERRSATVLSQEIAFDLRYPALDRTRPRQRLEQAMQDHPKQEMLFATYGLLLLMMGELDGAESALNRAVAAPLCRGQARSSALYNLACVCARRGRADECHEYLLRAREHGRLDAGLVQTDTDLESVRGLPWFESLMKPSH